MRFKTINLLCGVLLALVSPEAGRAEVTLRLLSAWTSNNAGVTGIENPFIRNIEQASKGEIKVVRSGPEVVTPFEQLQPTSAGVFDLLVTAAAYHQAQNGVGSVFDAIKGDLEKRRDTGLFQWADDYYARRSGVRILALVPLPGFHYLLREPLSTDNFKGLKIRTSPATEGLVRGLGAIPVNLPIDGAYVAMQKGTLDGLAMLAGQTSDYKLHEVAKYMTRPLFGLTNLAIFVNATKFAALPPHLQTVLREQGREVERIGAEASLKAAQQDEEILMKNGVKITDFPPAIVPQLNRLFNEGVVRTASRATPDDVKALYELARSKNMINE